MGFINYMNNKLKLHDGYNSNIILIVHLIYQSSIGMHKWTKWYQSYVASPEYLACETSPHDGDCLLLFLHLQTCAPSSLCVTNSHVLSFISLGFGVNHDISAYLMTYIFEQMKRSRIKLLP